MKQYSCPTCQTILEEVSGCGSVSYFCPSCKKLVSRKAIVEVVEATSSEVSEEKE